VLFTGAYESYPVTLILGEEEMILAEDAAFLAEFSEYFATALYSNYAEARAEYLRLPVK